MGAYTKAMGIGYKKEATEIWGGVLLSSVSVVTKKEPLTRHSLPHLPHPPHST